MLRLKDIERLPTAMVELYSRVEIDALCYMAERIKAVEDFIPASQWQYQKLIEMGNYHSYIVKALAALAGKTETEIKRLIRDSGQTALHFDDAVYRQAGLVPPPLAASPAIQAVMAAGLESTKGLFENLTRTTADTSTRQFERALDRAWLQVHSGAFSHQEAVRMAVKELSEKGLSAIEYPSGHVDALDVAVRRAVLTGVNQTALKMQEKQAEELGCDLVEVTAHAGARTGVGAADHAGWQGKVYSRSGNHARYPSLMEKTGYGTGPGLGGWNCRHSMFPFFEGLSTPTYTEKELAELNAPKYIYNGKKMTEYEATQRQRYIERQIRRWKRENLAMKAAGQDTAESAAKLRQWQTTQKDFLEQTGLKRQYGREQVQMPKTAASGAARNTGKQLSFDPDADYNIRVPEWSDETNRSVSDACREVARLGGADHREHLILADLRDGRRVYLEDGDEGGVGGPGFWKTLETLPPGTGVFIHNHPTDGYLSETDMRTLLTSDGLGAMIATRNDGVQYLVLKDLTRPKPVSTIFDTLYPEELAELTRMIRSGKIEAADRTYLREEIIVNNLIRDYTKGLVEFDGRNK